MLEVVLRGRGRGGAAAAPTPRTRMLIVLLDGDLDEAQFVVLADWIVDHHFRFVIRGLPVI